MLGCSGAGQMLRDPRQGEGRVGGGSPTALPAGALVAAAARKETCVLSGGRFGQSRVGAAEGLPGKRPLGSNSRLPGRDTHVQQRGCPSDGTTGAPSVLQAVGTGAAGQGRGDGRAAAAARCIIRARAQYSQGKNFF